MCDSDTKNPLNFQSRTGALRTLHPLQLQAECGIGPSSGFHQLPIETDRIVAEHIELAEVECDVDTMKKLKLGTRSTLWSRPTSTTSQSQKQLLQQQLPQHQQDGRIPLQSSMKQQTQQSQPHQLQPQRPQQSPASGQKLLAGKSDYSISV